MPALNALAARDAVIIKRGWPAQNVGVMVVFCIVGAVAIAIIFILLHKLIARKRAQRAALKAQHV